MPRDPRDKCDVGWDERYGTTWSGNLPQWERTVCIEDTIDLDAIQAEFPWVKYTDFHFYHKKCPYSNESSIHYVRDTDRSSATYWQLETVLGGDRTNHTSTDGMMIRYSRGSRHGWLCVDPDCSYYLTNNTPYFHY